MSDTRPLARHLSLHPVVIVAIGFLALGLPG